MEEVMEVATAVRRLCNEFSVPPYLAAAAINEADGSFEGARLVIINGGPTMTFTRMPAEPPVLEDRDV